MADETDIPPHIAGYISVADYLPDSGLDAIERLLDRLPENGRLGAVQASRKSVTSTLRFDTDQDPLVRTGHPRDFLLAASCVDTLVKNLRAERASRG